VREPDRSRLDGGDTIRQLVELISGGDEPWRRRGWTYDTGDGSSRWG
jgi:hypothetical protein